MIVGCYGGVSFVHSINSLRVFSCCVLTHLHFFHSDCDVFLRSSNIVDYLAARFWDNMQFFRALLNERKKRHMNCYKKLLRFMCEIFFSFGGRDRESLK